MAKLKLFTICIDFKGHAVSPVLQINGSVSHAHFKIILNPRAVTSKVPTVHHDQVYLLAETGHSECVLPRNLNAKRCYTLVNFINRSACMEPSLAMYREGKSRCTVVSTQSTEFILVLLFSNYWIIFQTSSCKPPFAPSCIL